MTDIFTNIQKEARKIRLSADEKQRMRVALYDAMRVPRSLGEVGQDAPKEIRAVRSPYWWFSPAYVVPIALLLVVGVSSGTAYAAQGALPGDALYAVKIHVDEQIQTALAVSPQAKAQVQASLAQERLQEAEALAAANKLDASTSAQLSDNFDTHVMAAQTSQADVAHADPGEAAQLSAEFDSTLQAHSAILSQLGSSSTNPSSRQDTLAFASRIRSHERHHNDDGSEGSFAAASSSVALATSLPTEPTTGVSASGTSSSQTSSSTAPSPQSFSTKTTNGKNSRSTNAVLSMQAKASSTIAEARADYDEQKDSLDASTQAKIESSFASLDAQMSQGAQALAAGDAGTAQDQFTQALGGAVKLDAYLNAAQRLNDKGILSQLLGGAVITSITLTATTSTQEGQQTPNSAKHGHGGGKHGTVETTRTTTSSTTPPTDIQNQDQSTSTGQDSGDGSSKNPNSDGHSKHGFPQFQFRF